jgi:hypothetical protein
MPATTEKPPTLAKALTAIDRMTAAELREKYAAVFGEPAASGNRAWLARRVGWRMQALAEGVLSDRARARAAELARDADLLTAPVGPHDARLFLLSLSTGSRRRVRSSPLTGVRANVPAGKAGRARGSEESCGGRPSGTPTPAPWKPVGGEGRKRRASCGGRGSRR